jgi:hypothetical protein
MNPGVLNSLRVLIVVILGSLCALPCSVVAQVSPASARIRVVDGITGEPLEGATVSFPGLSLASITDRTGTAVIQAIPPGDHRFEVVRIGYGNASGLLHLEPGARAEDQIRLGVQPFEIAGIMVDGRRRWSTTLSRSGFYDRSRQGFGTHLDRLAFRRARGASFRLDEFLENRLRIGCGSTGGNSGARGGAATSFGNSAGPIPTQTMGMGTGGGGPVVFLDGIAVRSDLLRDIPLDWVEGLEFYKSSAGVPAQYAGWAPCGVVLVWTG